MSVAGYIGKNRKKLRIPCEGTDELGIHYGEPGRERQEDGAYRSKQDSENYKSVEDYDPVLRAHCRL
jgi:hypothetical protein